MKKHIKCILVILFIFLIACFLGNKFKTHHTVKYKLKNNTQILETYHKDKKSDYYLIEINHQDKKYIFDIKNNFKKKKKIVKDLIIYKKENVSCIYPILINEKYTLDIICSIDENLYAYASIKDKYDFGEFIKTIPNYDDKYYDDKTSNIKNYNDIKIYNDNLYPNENIIIYNYKNLIKIKDYSYSKISFSNHDIYNNDLGIMINNLYLIPKYSNKPEISSYYVIDILKQKKKEIKLNNKLSTNLYINGIVDDKLYIFDKSNIIQYELDPNTKKLNRVGNKNNMKFYDGKWIDANPYDYIKEEKKFNSISSKMEFPFHHDKIYTPANYYYIYNYNGKFYKVYKHDLNNPIFLFEFDDFDEVQIINDKIYFINDKTLYRYDKSGLKKVVQRDEFKYNSKNIYSAYFE